MGEMGTAIPKIGNSITSAEEFDTSSLLQTFPEEIWSTILANIDKATDYHRLCRSALLFQNLLHKQRILVLFPDVFETLTTLNATKNWKWRGNGERQDVSQKYLNDHVQDLAALRLVCQRWKSGVDRALQNLPYLYMFEDEQRALKTWYYGSLETYYNTVFRSEKDRIQDFESHFESTHSNGDASPFIGGKVVIVLPIGSDLNFLEENGPVDNLILLLKKYGKHILHLEVLSAVENISDHLNFYTNLRGILGLMPNLRGLKMYLKFVVSFSKNVYGIRKTQLNEFMKKGEQHSCPNLNNLKFVDQEGMYMPLFLELVKPNLQMLEKLGITLETIEDLRILQQSELDLLVKKLRLVVNLLEVPWADVLACVQNRFGRQLTELHLWLGKASSKLNVEERLKLPNLKVLHLKLEEAEPLDFLLDTRNTLETLVVKAKDLEDIKRVQTHEREIKLFCHFQMLYKSNVWNIFDKMKEVTLQNSLYRGTTWSCTKKEWKAWIGKM